MERRAAEGCFPRPAPNIRVRPVEEVGELTETCFPVVSRCGNAGGAGPDRELSSLGEGSQARLRPVTSAFVRLQRLVFVDIRVSMTIRSWEAAGAS